MSIVPFPVVVDKGFQKAEFLGVELVCYAGYRGVTI